MTFSNPAMLWGLLAIAIPIIIHLFNFHRYRKVYFSNVALLEELQTESKKQSRLRQRAVLALRIAAITFLVLAFAGPRIGAGNVDTTTDVAVSIYIDNSYSMGNNSDEGTLLDAARRKTLEVANAYSASQRFHLLTADRLHPQLLGRDELREAVETLHLSPAAPMMSRVVGNQLQMLNQTGYNQRHAYVISDFQRSTTDPEAFPDDSSALITLVPLNATSSDNLFIDTICLDAPAYYAGGDVAIEVAIGNSGSHDAEKVPVRLSIGGRERAITTIDVAAGSTAKTTLRFVIDSAGWVDGCVAIADYPITFDDNYYFCISTGEPIKVAAVEGNTPSGCIERLFANDSTLSFSHTPAARFQSSTTEADFIILDGCERLAEGDAMQLASWTANGGTLLAIPPRTDIDAFNKTLSILGAPQLGNWTEHKAKANSIDADNRLYRSVFTTRSEDMEMPSVSGHYSLDAGGTRQTIIGISDGSALLTHTPSGRGHIYLFTTPLDNQWTDFATQALFVPTVYNMALYSRPLPQPSHTLGSDTPIELAGHYNPGSTPPTLLGPNQTGITADIRTLGGRNVMILHDNVTEAGIYSLADEHIAFNTPRNESRLDFYSRAEIAELTAAHAGYTTAGPPSRSLTDEIAARSGGTSLWRLCLIIALAALAAETLILALKRNTTSQ